MATSRAPSTAMLEAAGAAGPEVAGPNGPSRALRTAGPFAPAPAISGAQANTGLGGADKTSRRHGTAWGSVGYPVRAHLVVTRASSSARDRVFDAELVRSAYGAPVFARPVGLVLGSAVRSQTLKNVFLSGLRSPWYRRFRRARKLGATGSGPASGPSSVVGGPLCRPWLTGLAANIGVIAGGTDSPRSVAGRFRDPRPARGRARQRAGAGEGS